MNVCIQFLSLTYFLYLCGKVVEKDRLLSCAPAQLFIICFVWLESFATAISLSFRLIYINNHKVDNWSVVGWLDCFHYFLTVCDQTPAAFLIELYKKCSDKLMVQMCYAEKRIWIYFFAANQNGRRKEKPKEEWKKQHENETKITTANPVCRTIYENILRLYKSSPAVYISLHLI